jgi:hypothetical protein
MLRKLAVLILSALLLEAAQPALAQKTGPNGGLLARKDGHQTELVVSPTELTVYILEGGKVHDTKGMKIRAVVQSAGKMTNIDLVDVVITGKDDHGHVISTRNVLN